jgi:hypothetical protein
MSRARTVLLMAHADFRERSRRFSFLVTLAISLYAGYGFLPPNHAAYATLRMGEHRGVYSSAWVGVAISLLTSVFVGIIGFYVVKNAIERDRRTRVGQILAGAPISRLQYVSAKALSNFAVLATVALCVALSGGVTQLVIGEDRHLRLGHLLAPFVFLTLPSLLLIAALAVFFESMPGLRGGAGNVGYFFFWTAILAGSMTALRSSGLDILGFGLVLPSMLQDCHAAFPDCDLSGQGMAVGLNFRTKGVWDLTTFVWPGMHWTLTVALKRAFWVVLSFGVVAAAALVFDRFRSESEGGRRLRKRSAAMQGKAEEATALPSFAEHYRIAALDRASMHALSGSHFLRLLIAEVRLLLKEPSRWWYVVVIGLWIASALTPLEAARLHVLPLVWIWPVLVWSSLGIREARYGTDQILFSTPHPLRLQIPAAWLGGVTVALLTGSIIGARLLLAGDWGGLGAWLVGACFIPALALALGVWTGTSRFFEGLYTAFWYAGPLQPIPAIDFMGASREAVAAGTPLVFAGATVILLALCFAGRARQLKHG